MDGASYSPSCVLFLFTRTSERDKQYPLARTVF
jgi:hypothetical protein